MKWMIKSLHGKNYPWNLVFKDQ